MDRTYRDHKTCPGRVERSTREEAIHEEIIGEEESEVSDRASRRAWARLLARVYEIDPLVCPKMRVRDENYGYNPGCFRNQENI